MRILVVSPIDGGPATYSKILKNQLPKRGFGVEILSFEEVRKYPKGISHLVLFFKVLSKAKHFDVVYAQDPVSVGLPTFLATKIRRKKFYLKIVGDYAWEQGVQRSGIKDSLDIFSTKYFEYPFLVRMLKSVQHFVAKKADKIIVPSEYLKKIVKNWEIKESKIEVIYNGVEKPDNLPDKERLRDDLNLNGKIIISVARLVPWKGMQKLISIMPEIIKKDSSAKLLIFGDGPEKGKIQKLISELNLELKVILMGRVSWNIILKYLKASDVFVLNTFYEGFSHLLLEAMSVGIPVVTTSVGGNPELIENNRNGLLVEFDNREEILNAITKILQSKDLTKRLSDNGYDRVKMFTQDNMIEKIAKIFT